jgi:anthranilate/para-aminobenzoate synthase component I
MTGKIQPSKKRFLSLCMEQEYPMFSPVYVELPFKPPLHLFETLKMPGTVLLESVKGPEKIARYSFIALEPYLEVVVKDSYIEIIKNGKRSVSNRKPLSRLRELVGIYRQRKDPALPPFQGGCIGLFSYDFVYYFERLPRTVVDDLKVPDAHFYMVDRLFAFDHKLGKTFAIVCPGARHFPLADSSLHIANYRVNIQPLQNDSPVSLFHNDQPSCTKYHSFYDEAVETLNRLVSLYNKAGSVSESVKKTVPSKKRRIDIDYEISKDEYMDMVIRAKEYIRAGDIFQSNLSQRLSAEIRSESPWTLYKILRIINPSPFAAYADFGDYQIVSSSPERLIRLRDGVAETRPIAGTRPRGATMHEDERMRSDLLLNEKERAEHIMLIDLERNDLGKVCSYGTIEVDELMITEDYSHVIHIVSNVKGRMSERRDAFSLVRATFPGGTITGVPKVRCMEIIDELEPVARGPYTGSLGYISFNDEMDLNIIIRTFLIKKGVAYVQAGAGIVADSDPEREYFETLKKAEALISTLERI